MPDIISRIKLDAQGADQAAREIRKITEAYKEAGTAAKNLSATGIGETDPFARATSSAGGVVAGGSSPADVANREERSQRERINARDREQSNRNYNAALRPSFINQGAGVAEAASSGRGGAAVGGALSGVAPFLGGAGIALAAGGALAMTGQRWAENEWERMQSIFGTGMAQRLGRGYNEIEGVMAGYGRKGVPLDMVRQFFAAGSQAGVAGGQAGTLGVSNALMEASRELGLDPTAAAQYLGTLTRGGVDLQQFGGFAGGYKRIGRMAGAFGQENLGEFMRTLTQSIDTALSQGVDMTVERVNRRQYMLEAYGRFGGLSIQGATAMNQMAQQRGMQAARVQRPEDIIAFQAMRGTGMSVTDTMLAMEQDPDKVNAQVYQYLKQRTGGDTDLLRLRLQSYLGGSMSQVDSFIRTQEGIATDTEKQREEDRLKYRKPGGESVRYEDEVRVTAIRQAQMLRNVEKTLLQLTTGFQNFFQNIMGGELPNKDVLSMTWGGYSPELVRAMEDDDRHGLQIHADTLDAQTIDLWRRRAGIPQSEEWQDLMGVMAANPDAVSEDEYQGAYRLIATRYLNRAMRRYGGEGETPEQQEALQALGKLYEVWVNSQVSTVDNEDRMIQLLEGIQQALAAEGYVLTDNLEKTQ